jgi:predicted KAP-like P-loop ATPase
LRTANPNYPVLDFNPWQFSGSGDLSGRFLRELDSILKTGSAGGSSSKASKLLRTYARRLTGLAGTTTKTIAPIFAERGPFLSTAARVVGELLTRFSAWLENRERLRERVVERALPEIKHDLTVAMSQLERPIVVTIDDIDRLNALEIPEIFQLVKINADFPKLIYFLLFDRELVCEALDNVSNKRGKQYLEKIVQVAYHLPEAPVEKIRQILFKGIDECIEGRAAASRWEKERWANLFFDGIANYFLNLRQIYRFLASFDFQVRHFERTDGFEVNPIDLLGLETLRVFEPNLYECLFEQKALLTGDYGRSIFSDKKQEEINAEFSKLVLSAADNTRAAARHIIQTIFPPAVGGRRGQPTEEWLRQGASVSFRDF